jgi:hypothetical protein
MATEPEAITVEAEVLAGQRLDLIVPYPAGTTVTVMILPADRDLQHDLLKASECSLAFWDNEFDDQDWEDA